MKIYLGRPIDPLPDVETTDLLPSVREWASFVWQNDDTIDLLVEALEGVGFGDEASR